MTEQRADDEQPHRPGQQQRRPGEHSKQRAPQQHDTGIVQQDVDLGEGVVKLLRALAHARQAGQVAFVEDNFGFSLLPEIILL